MKDASQVGQSRFVDTLLSGRRDGFFIECGAADGEVYSNSLFFELERNWTGLLIEVSTVYSVMWLLLKLLVLFCKVTLPIPFPPSPPIALPYPSSPSFFFPFPLFLFLSSSFSFREKGGMDTCMLPVLQRLGDA